MGDSYKTIDVERLISYSDDLVRVLKDKRDINNITQCLEHSKALRSSCDSDFSELQTSLQGPFTGFLKFFCGVKSRECAAYLLIDV